MKVILLDELRGKGGEGDLVEVAQGYAENYLFPNKVAQPATPGNIKQLEQRRHNIEKREEKRIADANTMQEKLDGKTVTVDAKVGENNQLFGSVTTAQIASAIKSQLGVEIDRKRITRTAAIKTAGKHDIEINLYREINALVSLYVGVVEDKLDEDAVKEAAAEAVASDDASVAEEPAEEATAGGEGQEEPHLGRGNLDSQVFKHSAC